MQHVEFKEDTTLEWRSSVLPSDIDAIKQIAASTGLFSGEEIKMAVELAEENLTRGEASGYSFIFTLLNTRVVGFTCYGPIPGCQKRYEIYWIAVDKRFQGSGIGTLLIRKTEEAVREEGGLRAYIETSSRTEYRPTHQFYISRGYTAVAELLDYFRDGDGKVIFMKHLSVQGMPNPRLWGGVSPGIKATVAVV